MPTPPESTATDPEETPPTGGPSSDDTDQVLTPGGWRPSSQVHTLEEGQEISGKDGELKIIETVTGKVVEHLGEISDDVHSECQPEGQS